MPKYYVETIVKYVGEVEADSEEEAEKKGWDFSDSWDSEITYDGVESISVERVYDYEDADEEVAV